MSQIVRRPDRVEGGITTEEKLRMDEHAQLWIGRAFRTDPIEADKIVPAIQSLYRAANLGIKRVIIVPSPLVMAFAGGFSAAIWWLRKNGKLHASATYSATDSATRSATDSATYSATDSATRSATYSATRSATDSATDSATRSDHDWPYRLALEISNGDREQALFMLECASRWYGMYQGGNMWSWWDCYLTAARDILGLRLPEHEKYAAWEACAIHGGFRIMHDEFCIVSNFPEIIKVDDQNRPHCDDGPSHRWRDGWALYYVHGVAVPADIIEHPKGITIQRIEQEQNAEVRRILMDRYGISRYLLDSKAEEIHRDNTGILYRKEVPNDEPLVMVQVFNSTPEPDGSRKPYFLRVHPELRPLLSGGRTGKPQIPTARNAVASLFGYHGAEYKPVQET